MGKLNKNKTKKICESQRTGQPMWKKLELLNSKSGDQNPLKKTELLIR
jgi:hypothetical protein